MLLPALEADPALARRFFERMRMVFYAGAGMPVATWRRLEAVAAPRCARSRCGSPPAWGSTETAPAITFAHWHLDRPGVIGNPMPGAEVKFVPNAGKLELRIRGPNIFPGYRDNEAATQAAFDEEGYYCIGDAGHLLDEADPASGHRLQRPRGRGLQAHHRHLGQSVGTLRLKVVTALAPTRWMWSSRATTATRSARSSSSPKPRASCPLPRWRSA
jgi:feruloyl-CoA synthase